MEETGEQDVSPGLFPRTDPVVPQKMAAENALLDALQKQQMKLEDNGGLLAELIQIEQDLRENLRIQEERRQQVEQVRREENHQRWRSLCFLILNQRTAKPWVTSYYKNIPMHIYCLPIERVNQQLLKRKKKKKKKDCK